MKRQFPGSLERVVTPLWLLILCVGVACGDPTIPGVVNPSIDTAPPPSVDIPVVPPDIVPDIVSGDCEPDDDGKMPVYCECNENIDCVSGYCIESANGSVCTDTCISDCPDGWTCKLVGGLGSDSLFLCVDQGLNLCKPCLEDSECQHLYFEVGGRCISYGDAGSFCGIACDVETDVEDALCPDGYECQEATGVDGTVSGQCVASNSVCACSVHAVKQNAKTHCVSNTETTPCPGQLQCGAVGVPLCESAPAVEICDDSDNDCSGEVDDNLGTTTCGQGACEHTIDNCKDGLEQTCDPTEGASAETCDGLDNDCNGQNDDGLAELSCGQGLCAQTVPACSEGQAQTCDPFFGAVAEVCDGLDNDCDGEPDDNLGSITCGLGVCEHSVEHCKDGVAQECDPLLGANPESCDGQDNDCNGLVDEGLADLTCGQGVCKQTLTACVGGQSQTCDPFLGAVAEMCDGLDNDCDGVPDDNLGSTTCGFGNCLHTVDNCDAGIPQVCDPMKGAGTETCDGLDNDCNGIPDDGLADLSCGQGVCATTVPACLNGQVQTCTPLDAVVAETCDGLDNDCDGTADEELADLSCGQGVCATTVVACVEGQPQTCEPLGVATSESCDGLDNDCNGDVDEGLADLSCGQGVCATTIAACVNGQNQTCTPLNAATSESCDGLDNDCNGSVDDGLADLSCGQGVCATTVDACVNGQVQTCTPLDAAVAEICDGLDNDCDGTADEALADLSCGQGICVHTMTACVAGQPQTCDPFLGAEAEVCDGSDNDCDGEADDNLGSTTCGLGECTNTVVNCQNGATQNCDPLLGTSPEICDGLDNDCDGQVDDGLADLSCGQGVCATTVAVCVAGQSQICTPLDVATPEICDGLDNDCNGQVDDGMGTTFCGNGVCLNTVTACVDGKVQPCEPFELASSEACNGLDNDCNGQVDDGLGSTTCGNGVCTHTVQNCVNATVQTCDPLEGSSAETCDGLDNDCDGNIDQGLGSTTCGKGVCHHTTSNCSGGQVQTCDPMAGASSESCDGLDNNCNGSVDEGYSDLNSDGQADCVDPDDDGDGVNDGADNCPAIPNAGQANYDGDNQGDACDDDADADGFFSANDCDDLCPSCYPGSTESTSLPDGKDQDCDDQVDENDGIPTKQCKFWNGSVCRQEAEAACAAYCPGGEVIPGAMYIGGVASSGVNWATCAHWGSKGCTWPGGVCCSTLSGAPYMQTCQCPMMYR